MEPRNVEPPLDAQTEDRDARLGAALVEMHARLVEETGLESGSDETAPGSAMLHNGIAAAPQAASLLDDESNAELQELAACLKQLERVRRATAPARLNETLFPQGQAAEGPRTGSPVSAFAGERIARFEIVRELGRGGLGMVLLARDPVLNRQVALKIPKPEAVITPQLRKRFHREGQAAARLQHPHIVPVYEVGQVGPVCFIAAAYIDGENLAQWLTRNQSACSPRLAAAIVADLADAMHYAHAQHILHRDLKPSNVLIERAPRAGDEPSTARAIVAKITDFGLAKLLDERDDETRHGAVLGTPAYMAPEQAKGDLNQIGPPSDVYSLGAILYELLTGRAPFVGTSEADTIAQVLADEPVAPGRLARGVPPDLEAICLHCLEKSPLKRFTSAGDLAADLRRYLAGEPTLTRPLSAPQRVARWARRKPALAGLVAVSIAALLTIVTGVGFYTRELRGALSLAESHAVRAAANEQASKQHEARANERLYVSQIKLADIALEQHRLADAERLLDAHGTGTPTAHLRGVEWYMLKQEVERVANRGPRNTTVRLASTDDLFCCGFTNDEKWLITGGRTGTLCFWDVATKELVHQIPAHESCVNRLALSVDGQHLATSSCDKTVKLWRLDGDECPQVEQTFTEHVGEVYGLTYSRDGRQLASGDTEGNLVVRDLVSGEVASHKPKGPIRDLCWSADGQFIGMTRGNDQAMVFEIATGRMLEMGPAGIGVAFGHEGSQLAILDGGSIHHIDLLRTPVVTHKLDLHAEGLALDWSDDGTYLVTMVRGHLVLHDVLFGGEHIIDTHIAATVEGVAISPRSTWVAVVGRLGAITLTDIRPHTKNSHRYEYDLSSLERESVIITDDASRAVVVQEREALVVDPTRSNFPRRIALPDRCVKVTVSTRGESLAAIYDAGIRLTTVATGKSRELPPALIQGFTKLVISDEIGLGVVICEDRVRVFDLETLVLRHEIASEIGGQQTFMRYRLSPNGNYLVVDKFSRSDELLDLRTRIAQQIDQRPLPVADRNAHVIGFTGDGSQLCVVEGDTVLVRDCRTLEIKRSMQLDNARIPIHEVSPDGRTLAAIDHTMVRLFDVVSGQELLSWPHAHLSDGRVQFSGDGKRLRLAGLSPRGKFLIYEWTKGTVNP